MKYLTLLLTLALLCTGCSRGYEVIDELPQQQTPLIPEEVIQDDPDLQGDHDRPLDLYIPGTYYGEGSGYGGYITAKVEVDERFIKAIEITDHSENEGYMDERITEFLQTMIDTNSPDVDAVAGATLTCDGIVSAVLAALDQAAA